MALSMIERFFFICELKVSSLRRFGGPPTARVIFDRMLALHEGNGLPKKQVLEKSISIRDIVIDGNYAAVLFSLSDPRIPDNTLENRRNGSLRVATRGEHEVPTVSAHLVVDIAEAHDQLFGYPAAVENIEHLSRSAIQSYLNYLFKSVLTESREDKNTGKKRPYSPRVDIRGHPSQTIRHILQSGGKLKGVKLVESELKNQSFGDEAYEVERTSEIQMKIVEQPTGNSAGDLLKGIIRKSNPVGLQEAKVVIELPSGKTKTQKLNLSARDATENFLIHQRRVRGFKSPLRSCEEQVRADLFELVKPELPSK